MKGLSCLPGSSSVLQLLCLVRDVIVLGIGTPQGPCTKPQGGFSLMRGMVRKRSGEQRKGRKADREENSTGRGEWKSWVEQGDDQDAGLRGSN